MTKRKFGLTRKLKLGDIWMFLALADFVAMIVLTVCYFFFPDAVENSGTWALRALGAYVVLAILARHNGPPQEPSYVGSVLRYTFRG